MRRLLLALSLTLSLAPLACDNGEGETDTDDTEELEANCLEYYECAEDCGLLYDHEEEVEGEWPPETDGWERYQVCRTNCRKATYPGADLDELPERVQDVSEYVEKCAIDRNENGEPFQLCDYDRARRICTDSYPT